MYSTRGKHIFFTRKINKNKQNQTTKTKTKILQQENKKKEKFHISKPKFLIHFYFAQTKIQRETKQPGNQKKKFLQFSNPQSFTKLLQVFNIKSSHRLLHQHPSSSIIIVIAK